MSLTRTAGSVLIERFRFTARDAAILLEPIHQCPFGCIDIDTDRPLIRVSSKASFKGCVDEFGACALDDDGDGKFDRVAFGSATITGKLEKPAPYRRISLKTPERGSVRQSILFLGSTSTTITLGYRETSSEGLARPAFSEEYTLPLSATFPQIVAVRDFRLKLIRLSGEGLTFEREP